VKLLAVSDSFLAGKKTKKTLECQNRQLALLYPIVYLQCMQAKDAPSITLDSIPPGAELTEEHAKSIFALGEETVGFALLKQAHTIFTVEDSRAGPVVLEFITECFS
jgi:hypothetical protein